MRRAFFVCLIAFLAMNVVAGLLLLTEGRDLLRTLFETTSAFGTVGLSMGHNGQRRCQPVGHFSAVGKLLIALMMFIGRLGPLTLAVALAAAAPRGAGPVPRRQGADWLVRGAAPRDAEAGRSRDEATDIRGDRPRAVRRGDGHARWSQLGHDVIGIDGGEDSVRALADLMSQT